MAVRLFFEAKLPPGACPPAALRKAAEAALSGPLSRGPVNVVYTGDAGIRKLNKRFLGKDRVTDVIAFNYPPSPVKGAVLGEVYVCVPQARRQAAGLGHSLSAELLVLTVHGALHLSGMDDATRAQRAAMNAKTSRLLNKLRF